MPPMTKEQLVGLINETITPKIGSTIDERIAAHKAQQDAQFTQLMAGRQERAPEPNKGLLAAQFIMSIVGSDLRTRKEKRMVSPADYAQEKFGAESPVFKQLAASTGAAGGFAIPEQWSSDFIELLRPASVIRRMNPTTDDLSSGVSNIPGLSGGASGGYIGENKNAPKSGLTFRNVKAVAKKLAVLVPVSNDWIRRASAANQATVRDDMVAALAQASDLAFIRSQGTANEPKGLLYWAPTANKFNANATVNLANVTADLGKAVLKLMENNVRMLRCGWLFAPRTWNYLMTLRDANGNFAFRDELLRGTLWGWPWAMTTQIPTNLGGTTDESEVYFADFADVVLSEATGIMIDSSDVAAYHDGSAVQAAFSLDQTVIRAIMEHDLVARHDESISVIQAVKWI